MVESKTLDEGLSKLDILKYGQADTDNGTVEVVTGSIDEQLIELLKDVADEFGYRVVLDEVDSAELGNAYVWHLEEE